VQRACSGFALCVLFCASARRRSCVASNDRIGARTLVCTFTAIMLDGQANANVIISCADLRGSYSGAFAHYERTRTLAILPAQHQACAADSGNGTLRPRTRALRTCGARGTAQGAAHRACRAWQQRTASLLPLDIALRVQDRFCAFYRAACRFRLRVPRALCGLPARHASTGARGDVYGSFVLCALDIHSIAGRVHDRIRRVVFDRESLRNQIF